MTFSDWLVLPVPAHAGGVDLSKNPIIVDGSGVMSPPMRAGWI